MRTISILGIAILFLGWSLPAAAQWVPVAEIKGFGQVLAAGGGTVFVGDPENTYILGRVFVYERDDGASWGLHTTLEAQDGALDDRFGSALAVDDEGSSCWSLRSRSSSAGESSDANGSLGFKGRLVVSLPLSVFIIF